MSAHVKKVCSDDKAIQCLQHIILLSNANFSSQTKNVIVYDTFISEKSFKNVSDADLKKRSDACKPDDVMNLQFTSGM